MSEHFYKAFEDRYRGSREVIARRLHAYLPFIAPLAALYQPARALDVGCGRGEWLELAGRAGFQAHGVDLDDAMLAACRELGLSVETADAIATLRATANNSLAMVSAFHVVEHIPFDAVRTLVAEALRVLQPGGLLIMETPNPENLVVGAGSFYRDPSHVRPLPPELLAFATEHGGFARTKVVRLQEPQELHGDIQLGMQHVLEGVSPDYAIVAQKAAAPGVLAQFDAAFAVEYGISLGVAAHRYDVQSAQLRGRLDTATSYGEQALDQLEAVRGSVATLAAQVTHSHSELGEQVLRIHSDLDQRLAHSHSELNGQLHRLGHSHSELNGQLQQLAERLAVAEARGQQVDAMLASRSWRVTAPLRSLGGWARRLRAAVQNRTLVPGAKRRAIHAVRQAGQAVLRDPRARRAARSVLARFPALQARLREMMYQAPVAPGAPPPASQHASDLSPRAQRIYAALKQTQANKET